MRFLFFVIVMIRSSESGGELFRECRVCVRRGRVGVSSDGTMFFSYLFFLLRGYKDIDGVLIIFNLFMVIR